ncbi:hypothetical protein RFI_21740, partial [Reticulomyxa filosa]
GHTVLTFFKIVKLLKKKIRNINNMGNRNTTPFQNLKDLPNPLSESQCVLHKHEILICGGFYQSDCCYSYHILKNEYEFICVYPSDVRLNEHCVVKLIDNNDNNSKGSNAISLLSFGGEYKHTLIMKYVSVWDNDNNENKMNKSKNYNEWMPLTDNHGHPIQIGREYDNYRGMRSVIGGSNNHLLFITYQRNNISVFNLNAFQFIRHDTFPTASFNFIRYHCFVSKSENGQGQEMVKANQEKNIKNYEMLLFCYDTGLSIEYDEDNNTFQFDQLPVCKDISSFNKYAYVCVNGIILFFGGWNDKKWTASKSVYKYSIQENKWTTFQNILPSPLYACAAILSEDDTHIHIIGGKNDIYITVSTHVKTKVRAWDSSQLSKNEIKFVIQYWIRTLKIKLGWIDDFDKIIMKYSRMK